MLLRWLAFLTILLVTPTSSRAQTLTSHQQIAFDIYKELVEINTVTATGDTERAAQAMAARLRAAGFTGSDVHVLSPAPRKGNLVARLRGTEKRKPIVLLAYTDVVDARPEDWSLDPFKLTERDGYFYGRGTTDNKFMATAFVANLIRYKQEGYTPERDIIVALEADEEIGDAYGLGIRWLLANHRPLIDASTLNRVLADDGISITQSGDRCLAHRLPYTARSWQRSRGSQPSSGLASLSFPP